MTPIQELLSRLQNLDVRVWADGDRLRYSAPKERMTEPLRREILLWKAEILSFLQKSPARVQSRRPPLARVSRETDLSLSFAQQRLWFIDQFEAGSSLYNIAACAHLRGQLDVGLIERSLTEIVRRHEILRTTFVTRDGRPFLRIAPEPSLPFTVVDLSGLAPVDRVEEALRLARVESGRSFDLLQGPLMRVSLFRLDADEHILLAAMHHIISDRWSVSLLMQEMASLYKAFFHGRPSDLPELPIQYADFAQWQREWLQGGVLESQLGYWKGRLGSLQSSLDLPADRPRPPIQSFNGGLEPFQLTADLTESIRSLARREGATLFMTLMAAFQALLYRLTGQVDFAVGTPIANRPLFELEPLIGLFVNTLVFPAEVSGDLSFRGVVRRVRETALEAYAHQDLPFDSLVDGLQPQRTLSHTPLFQTMFILQNAPEETLDLPGVTLKEMRIDLETSMFDLTLSMWERRGALEGTFEYNRDLFDSSTIRRTIRRFQAMLDGAARDPDRPISMLPWLDPAEQRQVLLEWNDTARTLPRGLCIHELFEAQAERTPDALAAVYEDRALTYRELNRRANQTARHLQRRGVDPDTLVGLCMDRSLEMLVGLLGILKAGGAYVPMDPNYPPDRLSLMIEDSGVRVILTQEKLRNRCSVFSVQSSGEEVGGRRSEVGGGWSEVGGQNSGFQPRTLDPGPRTLDPGPRTQDPGPRTLVFLDTDWPVIAQEPDHNLNVDVDPANLAYVIFTSGSTGKPKGVMITHGSAVHLAQSLSCAVYAPAGGLPLKVSLNAPISFDASVQQILMLLYGHTLVVIPQEARLDGEALLSLMGLHRVDVLDCVPSQLKLLLSSGMLQGAEWSPSLVLPGGEAIDEPLWRRLEGASGTEFFNMYGPTECTVDSTAFRIRGSGDRPAIGFPLPDVRFYIVDPHLQPLPAGVLGELLIHGPGVGRGYLNRPGLTAERFIPDPFSGAIGSRLYRSGDRMRHLPDGRLEFLERIDHQVKLRGFRIELGDIESALREHAGIQDAAVLLREDSPGDKRLVAYFVTAGSEPVKTGDLRGFLRSRLPGYMIPSAFVPLPSLPLNPSGKVDRRALPAPDQLRPDLDAEYVTPGTHAEEVLARIWSDVLVVERIGVHDNFFELGGDSILSIQVVSRANQEGIHFTPKELYLNPTISALAALARREPEFSARQTPVEGPVPLTPIQRWFFEQDHPEPSHWNQSVLLELTESLAPAPLETALEALLQHHDALRLRFVPPSSSPEPGMANGEWLQINEGVGGALPFAGIDLSELPDAEQAKAMETCSGEIQAGLDLREGPILRMARFDLGPGKNRRLLIVIHHLAVDGVSWRILLEDLHSACRQAVGDKKVRLPSKTTPFRDWALQSLEYSQKGAVLEESPYWRSVCRSGTARLPADFPFGDNTEASEDRLRVSLTREETQGLLQGVRDAYGAEVNDVLLTALTRALTRWTGADVLVELEGHGREEIMDGMDLSRTVGWFTSMFPVLLSLRPAGGGAETLKRVKEQLRRVPSKGIGYGLLRYLRKDRGPLAPPETWPRAQVSFNYLGQFDQVLSANGSFRVSDDFRGPERSPLGTRTHWLSIDGGVLGGRLHLDWRYSRNLHRQATIRSVSEEFMEALREIIALCRSAEERVYTPSDFPDIELTQNEVDALTTEILEGA